MNDFSERWCFGGSMWCFKIIRSDPRELLVDGKIYKNLWLVLGRCFESFVLEQSRL